MPADRRTMSGWGLGCAKTPAVAPHVEISPGNCIPESQIILHTRGSMPCWRIVFSTFCGCMSFYTGSVKLRKAHCERMLSGLPRQPTQASNADTSDSCQKQLLAIAARQPLFDHLVGAGEHSCGHVEAKRLRCLEVDDQLVLGRCLYRQVGRLLALEDAIDVAGHAPKLVDFRKDKMHAPVWVASPHCAQRVNPPRGLAISILELSQSSGTVGRGMTEGSPRY
jgi:hypothetical protein